MAEANPGLDLVHVLPSRAAGPEGFPADVGGVDVNLNRVVYQGVDIDTDEARVPPGVAVKRADAHQPVDAVFAFEHPKRKVPVELHGHLFDARDIAVLKVELFDFVAVFVAPHAVHPHQHGGPVATFRAARAGSDLHHRIQPVFLRTQHVLEFELLHRGGRRFKGLVHLRLLFFARLHEFVEHGQIVHR